MILKGELISSAHVKGLTGIGRGRLVTDKYLNRSPRPGSAKRDASCCHESFGNTQSGIPNTTDSVTTTASMAITLTSVGSRRHFMSIACALLYRL